jgi:hypothetical protein
MYLLGVHTWSDCYQPCVGDQWLSQGTDESVFELSTVIPPLGSSVEPITVNYVTDASDDVVATQATAATELNYTNDLDQGGIPLYSRILIFFMV